MLMLQVTKNNADVTIPQKKILAVQLAKNSADITVV